MQRIGFYGQVRGFFEVGLLPASKGPCAALGEE